MFGVCLYAILIRSKSGNMFVVIMRLLSTPKCEIGDDGQDIITMIMIAINC